MLRRWLCKGHSLQVSGDEKLPVPNEAGIELLAEPENMLAAQGGALQLPLQATGWLFNGIPVP